MAKAVGGLLPHFIMAASVSPLKVSPQPRRAQSKELKQLYNHYVVGNCVVFLSEIMFAVFFNYINLLYLKH